MLTIVKGIGLLLLTLAFLCIQPEVSKDQKQCPEWLMQPLLRSW